MSAENFLGVGENYNLHYATPAELKANGGICRNCARKFKRRNGSILNGAVETPSNQTNHQRHIQAEDHVAWDNQHLEPVTDFDFDAVEDVTAQIQAAPPDVRTMAADLFGRLMLWIWSNQKTSFSIAMAKFIAMTAAIKPELVGNLSYQEIGARLGLTKAAISKTAKNFERAFHFKASRGRSDEQAKNMAGAQLKIWKTTRKSHYRQAAGNQSNGRSHRDPYGLKSPGDKWPTPRVCS